MKCSPGFVFNKCGPKTERTCASAFEDRSVCVAGCYCPNGMIRHEGQCIRLDTCPCTFDGAVYAAGTETIFAS